ncbi:hypothetical protein K503DRAFT_783055 [Rhizopogon vinicolor AM-OR11-026]|uniref:Ricin B lectin domain-containing protein n=1 Tax=Rhizopogon vinicolor AM-OR11-026 TaxID=1314800 RepID=A0A1B7N035_9AGAM|nr:hypothetical protein K503DRAFT_783055 [Rhizopogon vinicolor AM-OR11-026]
MNPVHSDGNDKSRCHIRYKGLYNIFSNAVKTAAATILPGEDVLRGITKTSKKWTLTYVDRDNGICMISDTLQGGFLGLKQIPDVEMIGAIYLSGDQQRWILEKAGDDYTISQVVNGEERFWYLASLGDTIKTSSSEDKQTWVFEPTY